jgi:DNA-binding response OmpR family regulator
MAMQALISCGEDSLAQSLAVQLEALGLGVERVKEPAIALLQIQRQHFDILLIDIELHGSLELLEFGRRKSHYGKTVLVAIAAGVNEGRRANQSGADFILNKPLDSEMTTKVLRAARTMIIRESRESVREKINAPATLSVGDIPFDGAVVDISESGVGLECERELQVGQQLQIEFSLPGSDRPVRCTGKVARVESGRVGIQFLYLSAASAELVMTWLRAHSPRRTTTA